MRLSGVAKKSQRHEKVFKKQQDKNFVSKCPSRVYFSPSFDFSEESSAALGTTNVTVLIAKYAGDTFI
jgi:hypothetical protein